ncbi:TetR Family Transcriptional Regulator [Streptomyces leeuwenhoekii]|uniref:TetR Family Transcriptional Regulator n=1 Tax=Streptomyces leeuwenhoekii TaxID=1437453 RepID=A0A0F7VX28_STRLW|nr:TetR Family Transcriptional Regulator [Streptomyces leeuwenhoekii]
MTGVTRADEGRAPGREPPLPPSPSGRRRGAAASCARAPGRPPGAASTRYRCARSRRRRRWRRWRSARCTAASSKVHPLVATMQDRSVRTPRSRTAAGGAHRRGARGADPAAALRALRREPLPAEAMVRSVTFADRSVRPEVERVSRRATAIILDATGLADPTPERLRAVRVVEHPLHSARIARLSGRASAAQVGADIETACRPLDPMGPTARDRGAPRGRGRAHERAYETGSLRRYCPDQVTGGRRPVSRPSGLSARPSTSAPAEAEASRRSRLLRLDSLTRLVG